MLHCELSTMILGIVLGLGYIPRVRDKGEPGMENIFTTRAADSKLQALK
jgi:hypothetical protein